MDNIEFEVEILPQDLEVEINEDIVYPPIEDLKIIPTTQKQTFTHPNSYAYDIVECEPIDIKLEDKRLTPSTSAYRFEVDENYDAIGGGVVEAVTAEIDSNIQPENIKKGIPILGVIGEAEIPSVQSSKTVILSETEKEVLPDDGYDVIKKADVKIGFTSTGRVHFSEFKIPENVTSIDSYAFYDWSIENVTIPNNITSIGDYAFATALYTSVFNLHQNLGDIVIPSTCKTIGNSIFSYRKINSITIEEGVESIGNSAFSNFQSSNPDLTITIPSTCKTIGTIFNGSSWTTPFKEIIFNNTLESLPNGCFAYCNKLTNITFPRGLKSIGISCFSPCSALTELFLPNGLETIGNNAFQSCTNLKKIYFPNSIISIGNNILFNDKKLEEVFVQQGFRCSLDISPSNLYTRETLVAIFVNLADITGQTPLTLTIGPQNIQKLTEDDIAIATNKGWIVK